MTPIARILQRAWVLVPACACGYLAWTTHVRVLRSEYVTALAGAVGLPDPRSPTGYAGGRREMIIPERIEGSFHWISETQQMFALGEPRVRHVDYENAPRGRDVSEASPYRWWLGLVAWADHVWSGRPLGAAVERAALYADPLLQALAIAVAALLVAWRLGGLAAALVSVGLAGLFPFASGFLPGMPSQQGLSCLIVLAGLLSLLAGINAPDAEGGVPGERARPWFALAGIIGGLGTWVSVSTQVPVTLGIFAGALVTAWIPGRGLAAAPWRTWSLCGGWTVLAAYLAEYFPAHMASWNLESVHPLYGLAWMGGGQLLVRAMSRIRGERRPWALRDGMLVAFAAAFVASVPLVMWRTGSRGFLSRGLEWTRLSGLPGSPVATSTWSWLARDGATLDAVSTLIPLVAIFPALWLVLRASTQPRLRASLAVSLGPVAAALALACRQPSWWSVFDVAALAVLAAMATGEWGFAGIRGRWIIAAVALGCVVPGFARLRPQAFAGTATVLTPQESEELVERHLAQWLSMRTAEPGVVVYAPPNETTTLCFFGGLRGIGSFAPDNKVGFGNSLAIAGARTMGEVQDDLHARGVRYIIMPSWDAFFDNFARLYLVKELAGRRSLLANELRRWNLPLWLQPVPYQMPVGGGYEGQSVLVFEVVDEQTPAAAAARLAEYLVETGNLQDAGAVAERLHRFSSDVGALSAQAQVESASGDADAAARTTSALLVRISAGGDRYLPWDRRVSVAVVLARAQRYELSRDQVRRCVADANEARLRSLSTGSLYDLLVLSHSFQVEFSDPGLRDLAVALLPGDLRNRL